MYFGNNHVNIGQQLVGESITFKTISSTTANYDDDIPTKTITDVIIKAQVSDVSTKEREIIDPSYDTNRLIVIRIPKGSQIDIEDYFTYNNTKYTVIQKQNDLNYLKLFCENEQRLN